MKKAKNMFKEYKKTVIAFILGGIVFGTLGVFAATTLLSQSVYYNNTNSGATSTNVQGALDELYTKANTWIDPSYIDFTTLKGNSSGTILASNKALCIKRNDIVSCITRNYPKERVHIQEVFSDVTCNVTGYGVNCEASDYSCFVRNGPIVSCSDSNGFGCSISIDSTVNCS